MKKRLAGPAAVLALAVFLSFVLYSNYPAVYDGSGCLRKQYGGMESYLQSLRLKGLECKVIEQMDGAEGIPDGCEASGLTKTFLLACDSSNGTDARTAYETGGGGVAEFVSEEGETKPMHIAVSEHCHHVVFDEPFWYAEKQEMAGFSCEKLNESGTIYDMTLVCKEFMYREAQSDAGMELVKTIYFDCAFGDGKRNTFPVYETAVGRYVFFGELK
jgi:hypothetical protein